MDEPSERQHQVQQKEDGQYRIESSKFNITPSYGKQNLTKQFYELLKVNLLLKRRDWLPVLNELVGTLFILFILVMLNLTVPKPGADVSPLIDSLRDLFSQSEPLAPLELRYFPARTSIFAYKSTNPNGLIVGVDFLSFTPPSSTTSLAANYTILVNDTILSNADYVNAYFLTTQTYIDTALINLDRTSKSLPPLNSPLLYTETNGIRTSKITPTVSSTITDMIPYYMIFMFQPISQNVMQRLTSEKEKMRPGLVMMGMNESLTSPIILLVTLILYTLTAVSFGTIISIIFPDPRQSSGMSFLSIFITIALFGLGQLLIFDKTSVSVHIENLWMLLIPQSAFARVIFYALEAEQSLRALSFSNIATENPKMVNSLVMLGVDAVVWGVGGWYLDKVFPGFGRPGLHPAFFLKKGYWRVAEDANEDVVVDSGEGESMKTSEEESENFEKVDLTGILPNRVDAVKIVDVRKEFKSRGAAKEKTKKKWSLRKKEEEVKVAVDHVSLDLHAGQTLALLGHNGAGKTTLMTLLTGLTTPTRGHIQFKLPHPTSPSQTISVSTRSPASLRMIQASMGVCPQFDVLFGELTCREHLRLYASFKNFTVHAPSSSNSTGETALDAYITTLLNDVYLGSKMDARSSTLSGGNKRKLSLAISLLGSPRVLLLDEPTNGMDIDSTHQIWSLLESLKKGSTSSPATGSSGICVVLTTHSMEEAETLGDRIAMMSNGRLQVLGSVLYLKDKFGVGFRLVVEGSGVERVLEVVRRWVSGAYVKMEEGRGRGVIYLKSSLERTEDGKKDMAAALGGIFKDLREAQERGELKGVRTVGLSQSSLEEVFIALKEQGDAKEE
ncbi:ATP-binding cassette sub- A member 5 [Chytridiales sp. JEL 0842]|nr:ATP-binding cassette sub- A member 5 [Chytridiales sp. JEL 0842]